MTLAHFKNLSKDKQKEIYTLYKKEKQDFDYKMSNRVSQDVRINTNLWIEQVAKLRELYNNDDEQIKRLLKFLMIKGKQYKIHQDNPLSLDRPQAEYNKELVEALINGKVDILKTVMPKVPVIVKRIKPKNIYKKDGDFTAAGKRWKTLTEKNNLPLDYEDSIEEVLKYEEPNPKSVKQVKDWLFSLGWKPKIFIESFLKSGEVNKVPQIKDKNKNLCPSVLELVKKEPAIKELEDLGVIQHRLGIIKGFLRDADENNNIVAGIAGLTNTLRIRHKYLVNMPKPSAPYGEYIRSLIIPQKGKIMIGADLSSLENMTRNNFILPYDPDYVKEMDDKYYDSHLSIGVTAGLITKSESLFYKWWKELKKNPSITVEDIGEKPDDYTFIDSAYKTKEELQNFFDQIDKKRAQAKTVSYSALYGVGKVKLAKELKISQKEAKKLLDAYWKINWSVKKFASDCETKTVGKQMWVKNPLNGYWYSLRSEKDIFSTVNQSAGDYIFTMWVYFLLEMGVTVQGAWHDEILTTCHPSEEKETVEKIYKAIEKVNKAIGLEIPIGIDHNIGTNYSEVH